MLVNKKWKKLFSAGHFTGGGEGLMWSKFVWAHNFIKLGCWNNAFCDHNACCKEPRASLAQPSCSFSNNVRGGGIGRAPVSKRTNATFVQTEFRISTWKKLAFFPSKKIILFCFCTDPRCPPPETRVCTDRCSSSLFAAKCARSASESMTSCSESLSTLDHCCTSLLRWVRAIGLSFCICGCFVSSLRKWPQMTQVHSFQHCFCDFRSSSLKGLICSWKFMLKWCIPKLVRMTPQTFSISPLRPTRVLMCQMSCQRRTQVILNKQMWSIPTKRAGVPSAAGKSIIGGTLGCVTSLTHLCDAVLFSRGPFQTRLLLLSDYMLYIDGKRHYEASMDTYELILDS